MPKASSLFLIRYGKWFAARNVLLALADIGLLALRNVRL